MSTSDSNTRAVRTVHGTCPHDCPSTCALEVEKLDSHHIGRIGHWGEQCASARQQP